MTRGAPGAYVLGCRRKVGDTCLKLLNISNFLCRIPNSDIKLPTWSTCGHATGALFPHTCPSAHFYCAFPKRPAVRATCSEVVLRGLAYPHIDGTMRRRGMTPPSVAATDTVAAVPDEVVGEPGVVDETDTPVTPGTTSKEVEKSSGDGDGSMFECNICFDAPRDPVVTRCGHLYCWACLWRWMRQRAGASQCPVCKAAVARDTVTPIYGRGRADGEDPRDRPEPGPPRPAGQRPPAAAPNVAPGMPPHPYWHPAAFGRLNAYTGVNGNLALATFGNFPSLFGMEIAYPQLNEQAADVPRLTPEQETREQVAKVFLFLALFIIVIITLF